MVNIRRTQGRNEVGWRNLNTTNGMSTASVTHKSRVLYFILSSVRYIKYPHFPDELRLAEVFQATCFPGSTTGPRADPSPISCLYLERRGWNSFSPHPGLCMDTRSPRTPEEPLSLHPQLPLRDTPSLWQYLLSTHRLPSLSQLSFCQDM